MKNSFFCINFCMCADFYNKFEKYNNNNNCNPIDFIVGMW